MLSAKKQLPSQPPLDRRENNADTSALERQIDPVRNHITKHLVLDSSEISNGVDEMVYTLYGLTPEEIAIIKRRR